MLNMADHADDLGEGIHPSKATIADETGFSRGGIIAAIHGLINDQCIRQVGNHRGVNGDIPVYAINLAKVASLPIVPSHQRHARNGRYDWLLGMTSHSGEPVKGEGTSHSGEPDQSSGMTGLVHGDDPNPHITPKNHDDDSSAEIDQAIGIWNQLAQRIDRPTVRSMNANRRAALTQLLAEHGLRHWTDAIGEVEASRWLRSKSWLSFDWLLKPANFTKTLEGNYRRDIATDDGPVNPLVRAALALKAEDERQSANWKLIASPYSVNRSDHSH